MKTTLWLTTFSLALSAPLGFAKSDIETLRATVEEQNRQIRQLEEANMKLRSLNGENVKPPAPAANAPTVKADSAKNDSPKNEAPADSSTKIYTVKSGDTLAKIARKTDSTPEALAKLNAIKDPTRLSIGQKIKLPGSKSAVASAAAKPAEQKTVPGSDTYIVRDNETFYSIARKYNVSADSLVAANPGIKASELRTGQLIRLSAKPTASAAAKTAPAKETETASVSRKEKETVSRKEPEAPRKEAAAAPRKEAPAAEKSSAAHPANSSPTASASPAPAAETAKTPVRSVTIDGEMTYGEFAEKHGTKVERLNEINGLDLPQNTVLAKGSELYVAQP